MIGKWETLFSQFHFTYAIIMFFGRSRWSGGSTNRSCHVSNCKTVIVEALVTHAILILLLYFRINSGLIRIRWFCSLCLSSYKIALEVLHFNWHLSFPVFGIIFLPTRRHFQIKFKEYIIFQGSGVKIRYSAFAGGRRYLSKSHIHCAEKVPPFPRTMPF